LRGADAAAASKLRMKSSDGNWRHEFCMIFTYAWHADSSPEGWCGRAQQYSRLRQMVRLYRLPDLAPRLRHTQVKR